MMAKLKTVIASRGDSCSAESTALHCYCEDAYQASVAIQENYRQM